MASVIVIALFALCAQTYAQEVATAQSTNEQLSINELIDKLADEEVQDKLVDKFISRAQEKLDNLDLNDVMEDTLLAKGAPATKKATTKVAPKRKAPEPQGDWLSQALTNLGSQGGVTPTMTRSGAGVSAPTRGMRTYEAEEANKGPFGMTTPKFLRKTKTKALPTPQQVSALGGLRPRMPQTLPRQNAFGGMRPPVETLAEEDTQTTFDGVLPAFLISSFVGMAVTFAAVRLRRGASMADQDYKPL